MLDKEIQIRKKIKRRRFFSNTAKGVAALFLANMFPFRLFLNRKQSKVDMKVQIHPSAVQRKNRG